MLVMEVGKARRSCCNGGECEEETKNEDEVNDIHAGYRILLPSGARSRLPSFCLSLFFFFLLSSLHVSLLYSPSLIHPV